MGAPKGNKFAVGNKGGRPTKYGDDVLEIAWEYVNGGFEEFGVYPTLERLALVLGISSETVQAWEKHDDKKEFSVITNIVRDLQADLLMNKCLLNEWNSRTGNLLLGKHGYTSKLETENKNENKVELVGASQELLDKVAQLKERIMNADKKSTE